MRRCLPLVCTLGGCAFFDGVRDGVEGAFEPLVAVGVVAHVEAPDALPDGVQLPDELNGGTGARVFLADARSVTDLESAPVPGATLRLAGCGDEALLTDHGDGSYSMLGDLADCEGPMFTVQREDVNPGLLLKATVPEPWSPAVPAQHGAEQALALDLSAAPWDAALVVVFDGGGNVVFSNEPEGIGETYQMLSGRQDLDAPIVVPGEALAGGVHVIAITGLVRTPGRDHDEVNTILSTVAGGRTTMHPVLVL